MHPAVPVKKHSPAADKKMADVRLKAMQLGIFKINEPDLKERYQFLNEIGMYSILDLPSAQTTIKNRLRLKLIADL